MVEIDRDADVVVVFVMVAIFDGGVVAVVVVAAKSLQQRRSDDVCFRYLHVRAAPFPPPLRPRLVQPNRQNRRTLARS